MLPGGGIIPAMIDKVGVVVPACESRYSSNVLGGDYLPAERLEAMSKALFAARFDPATEPDDGGLGHLPVVLALVPDVENTYNRQAIAVVMPDEDGTVRMENQIGWVPNGRCATVQPRLMSLMRVTGKYAGVQADARYHRQWDDDSWETSSWNDTDVHYKIRLARWEVLHHEILKLCREGEPDVVQPWVGNWAPHTPLSRKLYADGAGRSESGLLPVYYEILAPDLVATLDGEVVTNLSDVRRDFFDPLGDRVQAEGSARGWVRLHAKSVEVRHEGEQPPPSDTLDGSVWNL